MVVISAAQQLKIRKFNSEVLQHTHRVRHRFSATGGKDLEDVTREEQLVVLGEEVGKLARATNKLRIVRDDQQRRAWAEEHHHRLVTIASVAARIASS